MKENIKLHERILKKEVFFNKEKWPHFDLLFNDIKKIAKKTKIEKKKF